MQIKVWDLPTRLFHWLLVFSLCGCAFSVFYLEDMMLHAYCGYAVSILLVFRLVWGFYGGHWSRFSSFVPSVKASLAYLRQNGVWHQPGHNPLAAWSVWAMLMILLLQVGSGLCADDDAGFSGPLSAWVSSSSVELLTLYHADIGKWLLIALIGLHLGAVLFQVFYKRQALVRAMWSGYLLWPQGNPASSADDARQRLKALSIFAVCTALVLTGVYVLQTRVTG